jgi:hypothetical protein
MHGDLCDPVTPTTPRGQRYFLLLVNDLSRYMWVMVLGSKGEAADTIRRAQVAQSRRATVSCACCALTMAVNSRRLNSRRTVRMRVFSATTPRRTARSRIALSSGTTRRLWGWLGPS